MRQEDGQDVLHHISRILQVLLLYPIFRPFNIQTLLLSHQNSPSSLLLPHQNSSSLLSVLITPLQLLVPMGYDLIAHWLVPPL